MKKLLLIVITFGMFCESFCQEKINWNPANNVTNGPVMGYEVFYGTHSSNYTQNVQISVGTNSTTLSNLLYDTIYYVNISAYNSNYIGPYCGEIHFAMLRYPTNIHIK